MSQPMSEKRFWVQYCILTLLLAMPLLWAFVRVRNYYPVAASTMMMGGNFERGTDYYILRGETVSGETVEVNPTRLTNGLLMRTWGLVTATANNYNFRQAVVHPVNAALIKEVNGVENLPDGARVPDLIRAWGEMYNDSLPSASPNRLKFIRLDLYRWSGGQYADYDTYLKSWREEL